MITIPTEQLHTSDRLARAASLVPARYSPATDSPYRGHGTAVAILADLLAREERDGGDLTTVAVDALARLTLPRDTGTRGPVFVTHAPVISTHRDADTVTRSNYRVAVDWFTDDTDPGVNPAYFTVRDNVADVMEASFRNWAVGYVDYLAVRPFYVSDDGHGWNLTPAYVDAYADVITALEGHPVLDDDDHTALEHDDLTDYFTGEVGEEWADDVISAYYAGDSCYGVDDLPRSAVDAYAARVDGMADRVATYAALAVAGEGQMTLTGDTVRLPVPVTVADLLPYLSDDDHPDGDLPYAVARAVEDTPAYAAIVRALATVTGGAA